MPRFDYVKYDEEAAAAQAQFKAAFEELEKQLDGLDRGRASRAKALAITKLEEAYMWVGKSIRDSQIERNGHATLNETRA